MKVKFYEFMLGEIDDMIRDSFPNTLRLQPWLLKRFCICYHYEKFSGALDILYWRNNVTVSILSLLLLAASFISVFFPAEKGIF